MTGENFRTTRVASNGPSPMKCARKGRRTNGERGIALLSVLWVGVALGAIAAAVVALGRSDLDLAHSQLVRAEAELAADRAAHTAIYALVSRADSTIAADGSVAAWRYDDGRTPAELRVEASSEHGRLDLNRAGLEMVAALLIAAGAEAGEAEQLAASIADFTDDDDFLTPGGAERPDYAAAGLLGPKNAVLEHEVELLGVLGMPPGLYRRIADAVTVHSGRPAPPDGQEHPLVRAALTGEVAPPPALLPAAFSLELDATPRTLRPGTAVARSDLVRIRAEAETATGARATRIAVVSLRSRGGRAYSVLAWQQGTPELFPPRQPRPAE